MGPTLGLSLTLATSVIAFLVGGVWGGECCSSYVDLLGNSHPAKWCEAYCCGSPVVALKCCNAILLKANDKYRDDFCLAWFVYSSNIWALIVIGVLALSIIIGCVICCVRCCCR